MTTKAEADKKLADIFDNLADALLAGARFRDENNKPHAPLLSVARQFLIDNKYDIAKGHGSKADELAALPEFDDELPQPGTSAH